MICEEIKDDKEFNNINVQYKEWTDLLDKHQKPSLNGGRNIFKRSSKKITIQGRERCIYIGKYNKQYIKMKNDYVPLSSLNKNKYIK